MNSKLDYMYSISYTNINFYSNLLSEDASLLNIDAPRHDIGRDEDLFHALAESVENLRDHKEMRSLFADHHWFLFLASECKLWMQNAFDRTGSIIVS